MKKIIFILSLFTTILSAKIQVCVSIPPQAFFIQKITGDLADIEILVKPGSNPATYAPKPSQLKLISKSLAYFTIGVAFEKNWLHRFTSINSAMRVIDTTQGIKKLSMDDEHDHHDHGKLDPHVWLDPLLVKIQIKHIYDSLIELDSKNKDTYKTNLQNFIKELDALDLKIKEILKDTKHKEFIVFHPSFGYFANAYGLKQIAIEHEGKEAKIKEIKKIIDFAKTKGIKTIFTAVQFSQKSAKQIANQIDGSVKTVDPLALDWDTNILNIAKSFAKK